MARAIETHGEAFILVLTQAEVAALARWLDHDPPTLPDELEDLYDLLNGDDDE